MNSSSPGRRAAPPAASRTVLVAGGGADLLTPLARLLDNQGCLLDAVDEAGATLPALVARVPDAIVLVDAPPRLDAVALARRLRAHNSLRRTPVAVLADVPVPGPSEADVLPPDAPATAVAAWVAARLPADASPEEQLRITLARADDERPAVTGVDVDAVSWRRLFDHLPHGAAVLDRNGIVMDANQAFATLLGLASAEACRGQHLLQLFPAPRAAEGPPEAGVPMLSATVEVGGAAVPVDLAFTPAGTGDSRRVFVTVTDQRWRKAATDALQANHDLTEQLRRSQKIGALGRLAGGVAHDFNNLLQVIGGYAETLGAEGLEHSARRRLLQRIQRATDRATSLTRQLLAFGRRQVLVPQVLDLNVTVLSLEHMLGRVIGEDIQFVSTLASDLNRVKVDPGQIEQVLLNLAINARDAMSEGGALEIATANFPLDRDWSHPSLPVPVPAGDWVLLSVADTGCGMDPDTAGQAFEPFFTTKDASHGSGLGLSMVYGIVKQSGGFTWIDTAPGAGTSVHVLLPAVQEALAPTARDEAAPHGRADTRGGTVLLVEDDPEVRTLFTTFLRDAGYEVREAADGEEALQIFERFGADIDVVMTDVVMPNVSGPSLASALRARKPDIRVLFVSGYTDQLQIDGKDPLAGHVAKPVTRGVLLKHVATLLGHTPP